MGTGKRRDPGDPGDEDSGVEQGKEAAHDLAFVRRERQRQRPQFVDGRAERHRERPGLAERRHRLSRFDLLVVGEGKISGFSDLTLTPLCLLPGCPDRVRESHARNIGHPLLRCQGVGAL